MMPTPQAGAVIASIPNRRKVYFNGYMDSKGSDAYNSALSWRRAKKVSEWFVSRGYLPRDQADPTGYGKSHPVAPNTRPDGSDNPDGRAKNRRVETVTLKRAS
jgi:outer membrane protein OmpA-like peptidoglycan-associated protein